MKPGRLFLIGAAKCGTTTIDSILRSHPEVYMSPIKEPNFYSADIDPAGFRSYYSKLNLSDLKTYFDREDPLPLKHLDFVRDRAQYDRLFRARKEEKWLGESSTSYMYSRVAAANVAKEFPDARILVCLRDPVKRMASHYRMALQQGYVHADFEQAILMDQHHTDPGWGKSELFVELGRYGSQLQRWYEHFPKEHIHIINFADIAHNQEKTRRELASFLNISIFARREEVHANVGGVPRFPRLNSALRHLDLHRNVHRLLPDRSLQRMKRWMSRSADIPLIQDESEWRSFYRPELELLERVTGKNFDNWK